MCVGLAHIYHYGIWHGVSRCTYPRCAQQRKASRWLLSMHRRGQWWWCAPSPRITSRWLMSLRRRGRRWWCTPAPNPHVSASCVVAVRGVLVDRYVVHRHVMFVVIRTYLGMRFFPVGWGGGEKHAPAYMSLNLYFTMVPDTSLVGTHPGCALRVTSVRIEVAAVLESGSLYIYFLCPIP